MSRPNQARSGEDVHHKGSIPLNDELVDHLKAEGVIFSRAVEVAMRAVDRRDFVPRSFHRDAYLDHPLQIGYGQTISAPHMVAIMAEELMAAPGQKVLEIGTGSGYHAAVMAGVVGPEGHVFSVEVVPELANFSRQNLEHAGVRNVTVIEADGSIGLSDRAPFDRIYYTCSAPTVPQQVLGQLGPEGLLLGVVGPKYSTQRLIRFRREHDSVTQEPLTYCIFVPLIGKHGY